MQHTQTTMTQPSSNAFELAHKDGLVAIAMLAIPELLVGSSRLGKKNLRGWNCISSWQQ